MPAPNFYHTRLVIEATRLGTEAILHQMPIPHSPELEQSIQRGVRQGVLHYAVALEKLAKQLDPVGYARAQG